MADEVLRRYTDLPALIYLLSQRRLTLLDPRSWDDSNDSHYLELYREKQGLATVLALCFTQAGETYHHWRVFAGGASGVCIQFRKAPLLEAVSRQAGVRSGPVGYMTLPSIRNSRIAVRDLPFRKRYAFQHEKEFRLLYESADQQLPKLDIAIPLASIRRITLSPWMHPALAEQVKRLLRGIEGGSRLGIARSTLISNTEWKRLGESAS
jgi:hypothetical protein